MYDSLNKLRLCDCSSKKSVRDCTSQGKRLRYCKQERKIPPMHHDATAMSDLDHLGKFLLLHEVEHHISCAVTRYLRSVLIVLTYKCITHLPPSAGACS